MNLQTQHLAQRICHPVSREKIFLSRTCCAQVYWLSGAVSTQFELGDGAATVTAGVAAGVKAGVAAGVKAGEAKYGEETPAVADGVGTAGLLDCAGGGGGGGGGGGLLRETAGEVYAGTAVTVWTGTTYVAVGVACGGGGGGGGLLSGIEGDV